MSCDYTVLSSYLDGELPPPECRRVEAHVAACPECAAELAELRRVHDMLKPPAAPAGLHGRVMARVPSSEGRGSRLMKGVMGLAAAIAVAVAAYLYLFGQDVPTPPVPIANVQTPAANPPAAPEVLSNGEKPVVARLTEPRDEAAIKKTALSLRLAGTVAGASPSAVIVSPDGVSRSYGVGDEIQPGVTLAAVQDRQVVLNNVGQKEVLVLGADAAEQGPSLEGLWYWYGSEYQDNPYVVWVMEKDGGFDFFDSKEPVEDENAKPIARGTVSGRRLTMRMLGIDQEIGGTGEFNAAFTEAYVAMVESNGTDEPYRETARLVRVTQDEKELMRLAEARKDEVRRLYEPIGQYSEAHGGRLPNSLSELVPTYAADLSQFEQVAGRKITYQGGVKRVDAAAAPGWSAGIASGEDPAQKLAEWEEACRQVWQSEVPLQRTVLEARYSNPDMRFVMDAGGYVCKAPDATGRRDIVSAKEGAMSQNNLKQLGVVVKMFAGENRGYLPPGWLCTFPEYLSDPSIFTAPWDEPGTCSYEYLVPLLREGEAVSRVMAVLGGAALADVPEIEWEARAQSVMLGRAALADVPEIELEARAQSVVPLVIEKEAYLRQGDNGNVLGRNVLFWDGHVEFVSQQEFGAKVQPFMSR